MIILRAIMSDYVRFSVVVVCFNLNITKRAFALREAVLRRFSTK